jgi:hypothetical protein
MANQQHPIPSFSLRPTSLSPNRPADVTILYSYQHIELSYHHFERRFLTMSQSQSILRTLLFISASVPTSAYYSADHIRRFAQPLDLERRQSTNTPLIVTNDCGETIYPAILTQGGTGPGTGGFQLTAGSSRTMSVSENWQGRVWGRTNCTFNGGSSGTCSTGDCGGVVSCVGTVSRTCARSSDSALITG